MAASFDPSIISQIPDMAPNPMGAKQEAYSLASLADKQQLGRLQLHEAQQDQKERMAVKDYFSKNKLDYSTPEGVAKTAEGLARISPDAATKFMKQAQDYQSGAIQQKIAQVELQEKRQDSIVSAVSPIYMQLDDMKNSGKFTPAQINQAAKALVGPALQNLLEEHPDPEFRKQVMMWANKPGSMSYEGIKALEGTTKNGQAMVKQQLAELKSDRQLAEANRRADIQDRNIASLINSRNQKTAAQQGGVIPNEDLEVTVQQYLAGDRQAVVGLGSSRTTAGMQNWANFRKELRKQATDEAKGKGYSEKQVGSYIAGKMASFEAQKAEERAVGTRQAQIETAATEFYSKDEKTGKERGVSKVALDASRAVPRGDWIPVNELMQKWDKMKSDTPLYKFGQALDSAVNVYARAMTPIGVPTDASRARALEKLSVAMGPDAIEGVFDIMNKEIAEAQYAPTVVRDTIMESFMNASKPKGGGASAPAPKAPAAASSSKGITHNGKKYVRNAKGNWEEQ